MIRKTQPKQEKNMETEKKIDEEAVDIGDSLKSFIKKAERELPFEFKIAFGREDRVFETKFINPSFDYLGYLKESLLVACERNAQRIGKLRALIGHLKEIKNVFPQEELKSLFPHEEQ